ncbi:MAG: hypothetical protein EXS05_01740 [Planctomycetaceae bacterium]|nr:hypothetical protein [Planctomycetaceae bacterium]
MQKEAKQALLPRLIGAGALMGILGLAGLDAARAQEGVDGERSLWRSRNSSGRRVEQPGRSLYGFRQVQNESESESESEPAPLPNAPFPETPSSAPPSPVPTAGDRPASEKADELVGEEPGEQPPWSLTNLWDYTDGTNPLKDNQWHLGGNTVQSFVGNFQSPSDRFNGPTTWTDRSNDYQLNQQWIYLERITDTKKQDFDIGGRVDVNYGTNYRWATSAGFEDQWGMNTSHSFYGLSIPNLYLETAYKDVKIKWGHFISPIGFFTVDTTQNFFPIIPYTYQYGEVFTQWGALATWNVTDKFVVGGGITRGWDNFDGSGTGSPNLGATWLATYTFEDKSSLAYVGLWSNEWNNNFNGFDGSRAIPQFASRYLQSLVYSRPLTDKLTYVVQSDLGIQDNAFTAGGVPVGQARWYGLNQYLFWVQNSKWTWGLNFEWFRDEEGFRVGGVLPTYTDPTSQVRGLPLNRFGYAGNFYQFTFGPKWSPTKNLFVRPFLKIDWFDGAANNPGNLQPFNAGRSKNQTLLGVDMGLVY